MKKNKYTPQQIEFLRTGYLSMNIHGLTRAFNERFGTDRTWEQIKTFVSNRGIISGRTGQFEKGHIPWNNGSKGYGLTGANKGSFKKGNVPANRKSLGTERIDTKDGYILVKVAEKDPNTGFPTRYKRKHVYVWEQANGPVPKKMVVALRDSNKTNIKIENLMLISRAELLNLNRHDYREMPTELKPHVLALSKLQVKTWAREKY